MQGTKGITGLLPSQDTIGDPVAIADISAGANVKRIDGSANINIDIEVIGADAAPKFTLYGSNKSTGPWVPYSALSTDYVLPTNGSKSFYDSDFPPEYLSFGIDKNGGTTGTILMSINVKQKSV